VKHIHDQKKTAIIIKSTVGFITNYLGFLKLLMDKVIFGLLLILSITISGFVSLLAGGPGIVGVCGAIMPLICGLPAAIYLFRNPTFKQNFQGIRRYIFPAFIPVLLASVFIGLVLYDQNSKVVFRRLLSDPIPEGISNIQSYDNSGGFDVEYGLAFQTTPQAIDYIITKNQLELVTDGNNLNKNDIPFQYFPGVNRDQEWLYYSKEDKEYENVWYLWVNTDRNFALFKFIGY
jgi:hypothetical protein